MSVQDPEIQGVSIVFLGDFNPKIFQPAWFAAQGLIRQQEADEAKIQVIHPEVVSFTLEWLIVQVTRERFLASTTQEPYYKVIRDLVLGTFKLLQHTPLNKLGINTDMHFRMDSVKSWHNLGHRLAPKDLWEDVFEKPGLRLLNIEGKRPDEFKGYIQVQIQPSGKFQPGVYFQVNDHYEPEIIRPGMGAEEMLTIFGHVWDASLLRSKKIIYTLLESKQ